MVFHPARISLIVQRIAPFLGRSWTQLLLSLPPAALARFSARYLQPRHSRFYLHIFGLTVSGAAFIGGICFGLFHYLLPAVRALAEATYTMPTDTAFDAAGYDDGSGAVLALESEVRIATSSAWLSGGEYLYKMPITLKNLASTSFPENTSVSVIVDTKTLYDASKLQSDCDDLRVAYVSDGVPTEISRSYSIASGATDCSDSSATTVTFPLSAGIGTTETDPNYELYYHNVSTSAPEDGNDGYNIGDANATLVCPFKGTTTCVGGETPSTETGAIRYSGGKSAISFDGKDDYLSTSFTGVGGMTAFTFEFWAYSDDWGNMTGRLLNFGGMNNPLGVSTNLLDLTLHVNDTTHYNVARTNTLSGSGWKHFVWVYDGAQVRSYTDGTQNSDVDLISGIVDNGDQAVSLGQSNNIYWRGRLDEVRVSDTVRYTENFTPPTSPFVPDSNTKLLLHFDENGDDPRNTGKAIDASGNGNHGTITGAKYVSGLVGVDSSSTDTGYIGIQPYAGHGGVFIEEGTTNLLTNPSFDHTSYNTNWGLNYMNFGVGTTAFTAAMAKRNSAGPFAAGVMVQGKYSESVQSDVVSWGSGDTLDGYFKEYSDSNQGALVFWVTPEWNGNDGKTHRLFQGDLILYKNDNNYLQAYSNNGFSFSKDISDWLAGETYLVVVRWDVNNTLDNTNYGCITVDNDTTCGDSSKPNDIPSSVFTSMQSAGSGGGNSIIEGTTKYRRPLWDGEYGIDVGNGDEIEQIWNNGTGKDPTLVTGSWDVVFALPTNASTGSLGVGGTGQAWSHPHTSNVLYTSTTNTGGFMMNGAYTSDGWVDEGTPTNITGITAPEKIFSGGYQITSDSASEGIKYTKSGLTAGQNYVVRAIAHSDGTSIPKVQIWDTTNNHEITSLTGSVGSGRTAPDVLLFTFELPTVDRYNPVDDDESYDWVDTDTTSIEVRLINTESSGTVYWHQIELLVNKFDNPSFELWDGAPSLPAKWLIGNSEVGDIVQETDNYYSGNSAVTCTENFNNVWLNYDSVNFFTPANSFISYGAQILGSNSNSIALSANNDGRRVRLQASNGSLAPYLFTSSSGWDLVSGVVRTPEPFGNSPHLVGNGIVSTLDDIYAIKLNDVSLAVTPASQVNSTESTGLRVDGADTLTQTISEFGATNGQIKFKFTPRHSFDTANLFGSTAPEIIHLSTEGDADDYIKLYRHDDSTLRLSASFAGNVVNADWTDSPVLDAGTTYDLELSYSAGGYLKLLVNSTEEASAAIDHTYAFGTVPDTAYFGSDNSGANQYDCAISGFTAVTPSENTTSPYYKFGSKSLKMIHGGSYPDQYTINVGVGTTSTSYTLSAYVYDGTTDNVGGEVDGNIAQLYYNNVGIGTTYTDTGGGWWRLTATTTGVGVGATVPVGVEVKASKTIYVDGVQLEAKPNATTYTDGSLGEDYSWNMTPHASSSIRTGATHIYSGSGVLNSANGTISLWAKFPYIASPTGRSYSVQSPIFHTSTSDHNGSSQIFMGGSSDNNIKFGIGTSVRYLNKPMGVDEWHHLVITWNNGVANTYFDGGTWESNYGYSGIPSVDMIELGKQWGSTTAVNISDLRVFDQALTAEEVVALYYSGLTTHSNADESDDRYDSGIKTYTSPVLDLSANGQWGTTPISFTEYLGGGTISYFTRTSADNTVWSDWAAVTGSTIASDPRRYFQWKADLSANDEQNDTPVISGMTVTYIEDSSAPANPDALALGWSTSATESADMTSGSWYNHSEPKFTWEAGMDEAEEGQSSSGIDGYHVYLTSTSSDASLDNVGEDCYAWLEEEDREFIVGTDVVNCTLSDNIYYLRIQTKDNSGNVADPVTAFVYKYDGSLPNAPTSVSTSNVGYSADNSFTFYWVTATDNGPSLIKGYEYKTGTSAGPYSEWQFTEGTTVTEVPAYQEGQNFFYVRSMDNAGNYSGTTSNDVQVGTFYYNQTAPTAPQSLVISPETSEDEPAEANVFDISWALPASYSGTIAKYHYCVNCTPSVSTMTETTAAETVNRALESVALATQQDKNTFYIVAEDNNTNSATGAGNCNYDAYSSIDFWASTTAPGAPGSLSATDASDRDTDLWRVNLSWTAPSTGGTPSEYHIYRSTDNTDFAKIGETTSVAYTDTGLTQSTLYYYKVQAVDNAGSLSLFSNTVSEMPQGKYNSAPTFGGTPSVNSGSTTAMITWTTARDCYGTVEYGKTSSYGSAASETVPAVAHSVKLTGLSPGETYHFRVQNLDESDLVGYERSAAYSEDYSFITLTAAEISEITVEGVDLDSAVLSWKTTSMAATSLEYGPTTDYGKVQTISTTASSNTHTARLAGLTHSTTYHFRIRGTTSDNDDIFSQDMTFSTVTFPKVTAYVLKTDQSAGGTSLALAWSTNVKTTSVVEYRAADFGGNSNYTTEELEKMSQSELARLPVTLTGEAQQVAKADLTTTHVVRVGSLLDGTIYIITLRGRDESGNEAVSDPIRYVTGRDTRPPVLRDMSVETQISGSGEAAKAQILVSWETDEPASSQLLYGSGTGIEYPSSTALESGLTLRHMAVIRDLEPSSAYHLKIISTDEAGNEARSEDLIAVTSAAQESALDVVLANLEEIFGFLKL